MQDSVGNAIKKLDTMVINANVITLFVKCTDFPKVMIVVLISRRLKMKN